MATLSGSEGKSAYLLDNIGLKVTVKDSYGRSAFDVAQGECLLFLMDRNAKGFVTGSVVDKARMGSTRGLNGK